jgi:hypothetical protein
MARIPTEKVQETVETDGLGDTVRTHPAFAVIGASRVSGHATLAGSPLRHNGYINIRINYARENVYHTHSNFYPIVGKFDGTIVELSLSEAQWATFISTLNMGSGVPCTIEYARNGECERKPLIEDVSYEEKRSEDIRKKAEEFNKQAMEAVSMIEEMLSTKGSFTKGNLKRVLEVLRQPVVNMPRNMEFLADMLTEHQQSLVETAKAEVAAMVTRSCFESCSCRARCRKVI